MQHMRACHQLESYSGFIHHLLFIQNSESGLRHTGHFTTGVYDPLQIMLVFLFVYDIKAYASIIGENMLNIA